MSCALPSPGRSVWYGAVYSNAQYIIPEITEPVTNISKLIKA